jgi:hypothetical protein
MLSPINSPAPTRRPTSSRPAYGWDAGRSMAPLGLDRRYQTRATPSELAPAPPPNPAPLPPPPVHVRPGEALAAAVSDIAATAAARTKHLRTRSLTLSPVPTHGQHAAATAAAAAAAVTPERGHVRHCSDNSSSSGSVAVPRTPPPPQSSAVNPYTMFGSNSDAAVAATRMALYCASPVYTRAENTSSSSISSSSGAAVAARKTVTAAATAETPAHLRGRGTAAAAAAAAQQHSGNSNSSAGASLESGCLSPVRASAVAADATGAMTHQGLPRPVGKPQRVLYNPNAAKFCPAPQVFVPYSVTDAGNCSPRFIRPTVSCAQFDTVYCWVMYLYLKSSIEAMLS